MPRRALEPADFPFLDYRRFTFSLGIDAGDSVWLSGSTGAHFDPGRGRMIVEGGLVAQARLIFDKMRLTLAAAGLGLADVVRIAEYVAPGALADLPRLAALRREVCAGDPATRTVVVKNLLRPEALIEIEAVARRSPGRDVTYLPAVSGADPADVYARADALLRGRGLDWGAVVRTAEVLVPAALGREAALADARTARLRGRPVAASSVVMPRLVDADSLVEVELTAAKPASPVVFVAAEGDPTAGDVVAQCREIYRRLEQRLIEAGAGLDTVVKTTEFVTAAGLGAYRHTADVRREVFGPPYPAATGVVCERLGDPGVLIAVEAIAVAG